MKEDRAGGSEKLPLRQDKSFKSRAGVLGNAGSVGKEHKLSEFVQKRTQRPERMHHPDCVYRSTFFFPNKSGRLSAVRSNV